MITPAPKKRVLEAFLFFHYIPKLKHVIFLSQEYSKDRHHFNRTQVHRGYCVSSRCPDQPGGDGTVAGPVAHNASRRFSRCVSRWARRRALRARLASLTYCRTHAQEVAHAHSPAPLDAPQKLFLLVVAALLALNVLGTLYDVATGDHANSESLCLVEEQIKHNKIISSNYRLYLTCR